MNALEVSKRAIDAWNRHDADALVAADVFKQIHLSNNVAPVDEDSPHITTDGKQMWATGSWTATVKGQNFGPVDATIRRHVREVVHFADWVEAEGLTFRDLAVLQLWE
jgi:hypothetical protein